MGKSKILKGAVAGLVGGLVASLVMNKYQAGVMKLMGGNVPGSDPNGGEPATVKAGEIISEKVFGHKLTEREKNAAGEIVHYAAGGISGMIYGVVAEAAPQRRFGVGLPFGTSV